MIFPRRGGRGPDPLLERKVQIFFAGAALALVGIGVDSSILVGLAILILVAGVVLRFLSGKGPSSQEDGPAGEKNDFDLEGKQKGS